jgi:hypothetical protein
MQSLGKLLEKFKLAEHKPSLPSPGVTPAPERSKVNGNTIRVPVNRQAAMIFQKNRDWLAEPLPPAKLPTPEAKAITVMRAELKIERNAHAITRDQLGATRQELKAAKHEIVRLGLIIEELKQTIADKAEIIRQLEDLRL